MYLYTFVTTVVYEKKKIYIYTQFIKSSIKSCNCYPIQRKLRKGRSDYMIFYSSFYLDNAEKCASRINLDYQAENL